MKLQLEWHGYFLKPCEGDTKEYFEAVEPRSIVELELVEDVKPGSNSMLNTWRKWMRETAEFMAGNGVTMPLMIAEDGKYFGSRPFDHNDSHELFTSKYLGKDLDGRRKSWSMDKSGKTIQASKGDRLWCMDQHISWCTERGINLTIPRDGEYQKLKLKEVA